MNAKAVLASLLETIIKVVALIIIFMLVYKYIFIAYDYGFKVFGEPAVAAEPGRDVSIKVAEDYSLKDVAQLMENRGLIRDYKLFMIQATLSSVKKVASGTYDFNTAMTTEEMISVMVDRLHGMEKAEDSGEEGNQQDE